MQKPRIHTAMIRILLILRACLFLLEALTIHPPKTIRENQKDSDTDENLFI